MRSARISAAAAALVTVAACGQTSRPAHGEANSIIVVAVDSLWDAVGDSIEAALEPRIFTVRDEKTFELTHVSPLSQDWVNLRLFRQVLAIGVAGDGWVEPVVGDATPVDAPRIMERQNVWARNQLVTAVVLPPGAGAEAVRSQLPDLSARLDDRYRQYAQQRMFASGRNAALADTLRANRGYTLLLPNVYSRDQRPEIDVFRNHSEMGSVLLRTILVSWRPGVVAEPTVEQALAWRDSVAPLAYDPSQTIERERIESRTFELDRTRAFEVQGIWNSADPSWPAAGPFIGRIVACPEQDRTYYLDAWLFAPGRSKYQYMIQLQTLLDSFRCGSEPPPAVAQATLR